MKPLKWKDISSYSRDDTKRVPQSFESHVGGIRVVVTRRHGLVGWFLVCEPWDGAFRSSQTTECAANKPQNVACRSLVQRYFPVRLASVTPENVVIVGAGDGRKRRSNFVVDPASGALVLTARAGLKFEKALRRQARLMAFRLYLKVARLYFLELRFKARLTILRIRCKASSGVQKCRSRIHGGGTH